MFRPVSIVSYMLAFLLSPLFIAAGFAGTVSVVSMQYSADKFVPHIHYSGPVQVGDIEKMKAALQQAIRCNPNCFDGDGDNSVIVTLDSPGGAYSVGLQMAHLFRNARAGTVVERGAYCYSACAFAFLGGSAHATQDGVGIYIDRVVTPGGVLGFHAPYFPDKSLKDYINEKGAEWVQDVSRDQIAIMVEQLINWNVDPLVVAQMVSMGPDETWDANSPEGLYLLRASLPNMKPSTFVEAPQQAVRNACIRLLAHQRKKRPSEVANVLPKKASLTGKNQFGEQLVGYRFANAPLKVSHCSIVQNEEKEHDYDFDVSLYIDGVSGSSTSVSFFNRVNGWSTMGIGHSPTDRIFKKGSLNHYFMPMDQSFMPAVPGEEASELINRVAAGNLKRKFFTLATPQLPKVGVDMEIIFENRRNRVSKKGNVTLYETVGSSELTKVALEKLNSRGAVIENDGASTGGFIRSGYYENGGNRFSWFGLNSQNKSALVRIEVDAVDGKISAEDKALIRQIECSAKFEGVGLGCG